MILYYLVAVNADHSIEKREREVEKHLKQVDFHRAQVVHLTPTQARELPEELWKEINKGFSGT